MGRELSIEAKQSFQVVALVATVMVVLIHYQSAAPPSPRIEEASWNDLTQEFLMGGLGRVAVPCFAIAAGLFYFRSDDGTLRSYWRKLQQRSRTVLLPYFIIASIAMASWLMVRRWESEPVEMSASGFLSTWLLRPPAEQLWFLRDLMVLVAIAPLVRILLARPLAYLGTLAILWFGNVQPFPIVAGWHLLHIETLLFFSVGAALVTRTAWIERLGTVKGTTLTGLVIVWCDLIAARMLMWADFDFWYASDYDLATLIVHKASIVVGCPTLFVLCWRWRSTALIRLSGLAFFVYLIHEFPLRAALERMVDGPIEKPYWFWFTAPLATALCFSLGLLINRFAPSWIALLTAGRTPETAARIASVSGGGDLRSAEA